MGLANNLLLNLPEPFKRSTFAAAAGSGSGSSQPPAQPGGKADAITATPAPTRAAQSKSKAPPVPAGMVVAPWSVVALATLLHRCVRGDGHLRCMFPMQAQVQEYIEQLELQHTIWTCMTKLVVLSSELLCQTCRSLPPATLPPQVQRQVCGGPWARPG